MTKHIALLAVFCAGLVGSQAMAQEGTILNEFNLQPEVWRPASPITPGVDAKGDLSLSIPVLTIPGRGGLDYRVVFDYRAGITVTQEAGWLGLGWSFDPGSITRDVQSVILDNTAELPIDHFSVDYAARPDQQPDLYHVTAPGGAFAMTRVGAPHSPRPPLRGTSDFFPLTWRPWKIDFDTATPVTVSSNDVDGGTVAVASSVNQYDGQGWQPRTEFSRFVLTDEAGTRYVFAAPTMATHEAVDPQRFDYNALERYVNTWRLVAILGPDYVEPGLPERWSTGSWVRLTYDDVISTTRNSELSNGLITQYTYLKRIETPTHRAEFDLGTFVGGSPAPPERRRLTAIRLYATYGREEGTLVREVTLEQTYDGDAFSAVGGYTRMRLDGIRFYGYDGEAEEQEMPGYAFDYYQDACAVLGDRFAQADDFGYCNEHGRDEINRNASDGRTWSLRSITHPTGGTEVFYYENDDIHLPVVNPDDPLDQQYHEKTLVYRIDTPQGAVDWLSFAPGYNRQGGLRVTQIRRYLNSDTTALLSTTRFEYGEGSVSGVPLTHFDRITRSDFYRPQSRGQAAVYYEWVRKIFDGGHWEQTYYTTDIPGTAYSEWVRPLEIVQYVRGGANTIIMGNQDQSWGLPYRIETPLQTTIRELNLTPCGATGGYAYCVATRALAHPEVNVSWRYDNTLESEIRQDHRATEGTGASFYVSSRTDYVYDPNTRLAREIRESGDGMEGVRITRRKYVFDNPEDIPELQALADSNRLSVVWEGVGEERDGAVSWYRARATTWKRYRSLDGPEVYHPHRTFQWHAPGPAPAEPVFPQEAYSTHEPGAPWLVTATFLDYDAHGQVVEQQDARGARTTLYYGDNEHPLRPGGDFNQAYLTGIEREGRAWSLTYDSLAGQVRAVTDPNDRRQHFAYDSLGRLQTTENHAGEVTTRYSYYLSREPTGRYEPELPNFVRTEQYTGSRTQAATEFFDAYGRSIQIQQHLPGEDVVTATQYDAADRVWKTWKPYPRGNADSTVRYAADYASQTTAHYSGSAGPDAFGYPYAEQSYDAKGLLSTVYPPGIAPGRPRQEYVYGIEQWRDPHGVLQDDAFVSYAGVADEEGNLTLEYTDAFGRKVMTRRFVETAPAGDEPANIELTAEEINTQTGSLLPYASPGGIWSSLELRGGPRAPAAPARSSALASGRVTRSLAVLFDVPMTWDRRSASFTVPRPVLVHYEVELEEENTAKAYVNFSEDDRFFKQFVFEEEQATNRYEGYFIAYPGALYTVKAAAGAGEDRAGRGRAYVTCRFVHGGKISVPVDTRFEYDAVDNLRVVRPPNYVSGPGAYSGAATTTYAYNTLGQLVEKKTPDADHPFRYAYDAAGTLRAVEDPNRRGAGFIYTNVDTLGRTRETGVCDGVAFPAQEFVTAEDACANGIRRERRVYTYDTYDLDRPTPEPGRVDLRFPIGHLTQVVFDGGYYQFFYDEEQRLVDQYVALDGLEGKLIEYTYDWLGNVTHVSYQAGEEDAFHTWYTYDAAGRLETVSTGTADDPAQAVREAQYVYAPGGQIAQLQLGADSAAIPPIRYRYNARDWLLSINDVTVDPDAPGAPPFALRLAYNDTTGTDRNAQPLHNGNIAWGEWTTRGNADPASRVAYAFDYDAMSRLVTADFFIFDAASDATGWRTTDQFDVGVPTPIAYDGNGNILSLTRQNRDLGAAPVTLHYDYADSETGAYSNRLRAVSGGIEAIFDYDANGNVIAGRNLVAAAYDHRNLPASMRTPGDRHLTFRYDAEGQRVYKAVEGGAVSHYVRGAGGAVLAVYDSQGRLSYWNIMAGGTALGRVDRTIELEEP